MRRTAITVILALTPTVATARDLTWSELISPDRVIRSVVQTGLLALRSRVDLRWDRLVVDARRGTVDLGALTVWPEMQHDPAGECRIDAARAAIQLYDFDRPATARMRLRLSDVEVAQDCLPLPARMPLAMLSVQTLVAPLVTVDLAYDIPSAGLSLAAFAQVDGIAAATMSAEFSYFWLRPDPDRPSADPILIADLSAARLEIENLGAWEGLSRMLPPPMTDPETGGPIATEIVLSELAGATPDPVISDFAQSVGDAWAAFLSDPARLALETDLDTPVTLNPDAYAGGPGSLIADLRPRLTTEPRRLTDLIPADALRAAANTPETLSRDARLALARALATGVGVPRDEGLARDLLSGLDDPGASALLAGLLAQDNPQQAYFHALTASTSDADTAALVQRLESDLNFAQIHFIQLQIGDVPVVPDISDPIALRAAALAHLNGHGVTRSYRNALFFANLAAARGDPVGRDIAAELSERFGQDPGWAAVTAEVAEATRAAWIDRNLSDR